MLLNGTDLFNFKRKSLKFSIRILFSFKTKFTRRFFQNSDSLHGKICKSLCDIPVLFISLRMRIISDDKCGHKHSLFNRFWRTIPRNDVGQYFQGYKEIIFFKNCLFRRLASCLHFLSRNLEYSEYSSISSKLSSAVRTVHCTSIPWNKKNSPIS